MKMSQRELILSAVTGIVVLIGGFYWFAKPKIATWRELADNREALERRIELFERVIEQKGEWETRLESLRTRLSRYSADKDATADYLRILERTANNNKVNLVRRRSGKETRHGDLYELSIDCTWEASLEALVRFLNALDQENVTMDIAELTIAIGQGTDEQLKGDFTLICVYTRDAVTETPEETPGEDAASSG